MAETRIAGPFTLDKLYTWGGFQYGPGEVAVLPCGLAQQLDSLGKISLTQNQRNTCSPVQSNTGSGGSNSGSGSNNIQSGFQSLRSANPGADIDATTIQGAVVEIATEQQDVAEEVEALSDTDFATYYRAGVNAL